MNHQSHQNPSPCWSLSTSNLAYLTHWNADADKSTSDCFCAAARSHALSILHSMTERDDGVSPMNVLNPSPYWSLNTSNQAYLTHWNADADKNTADCFCAAVRSHAPSIRHSKELMTERDDGVS